jgi:hypothetical protein
MDKPGVPIAASALLTFLFFRRSFQKENSAWTEAAKSPWPWAGETGSLSFPF